jgi:hypothetical protein
VWTAESPDPTDDGGEDEPAFAEAFETGWTPRDEVAEMGEELDGACFGLELVGIAESALEPDGRQSPRDHFGRVLRLADSRGRRSPDPVIFPGGSPELAAPPWEQAPVDVEVVRKAIQLAATVEASVWRAGGKLVFENARGQLGHLVRYWLATNPDIRPDDLLAIQKRATTITYPEEFFTPRPGKGPVPEAVVCARRDLLSAVPEAARRTALKDAVEGRLVMAFKAFHDDKNPWSAAFVMAFAREVAIQVGLERVEGGVHRGKHALLKVTPAARHLDYVKAAKVQTAPLAYHAFLPGGRAVAVGDIIVMDRAARTPMGVISLKQLPPTGETHGDIVVAVDTSTGFAITVGGNVGDPDEGDPDVRPARDSVRCRRFPLTADGRLQVGDDTKFEQEGNTAGTFKSPRDAKDPAKGQLARASTRRIFALLSLNPA